jgi:riboflavin synthase
VDAAAELIVLDELGDGNWWLKVRVPAALDRYLVHKGSVAIDGVSLTVNEVDGVNFGVNIIPHTLGYTTLGDAAPGTRMNLEIDLIARYVGRLLDARGAA